jgi:hypothetical protein
MRIETFRSIVVLALMVGSAVPARAQSLAEVAQQEEARRKTSVSSGKTYTNSDLRPVPAPIAAPAPPVAATADRAAVDSADPSADSADPNDVRPGEGKPDEIRADEIKAPDDAEPSSPRGEAYWRKRMTDIRDQLGRDTSYAEAMQTRVDVLTLDFTTRAEAGQRIRIGVDRQKALTDLERLTKSVEDGKKAMAELEEEARQAGALPGWLR